MILVLPFANPDVQSAIDLLDWIKQLGGVSKYQILLVADAATDWVKATEAMSIARSCFAKAVLITNDHPVQGWPTGANSLFFAASKYVHENVHESFLWAEPDSCPIQSSWLEQIESDYEAVPQVPFMGHIYFSNTPGLAPKMMSGIAVYPPNGVYDQTAARSAWDVINASNMVKHGKHTDLIYHFWGQRNLSPTFVDVKAHDSPINTMTLDSIPPKAVLFHRCKDGSLLRVLKKKLFPIVIPPLLVVLPFCGKDVECALRNVQWIAELGGARNYQALLSYDDETRKDRVNEIVNAARQAFGSVQIHSYRVAGNHGWPQGANIAFQQTARYVQDNYKISWLWCEPDAVLLKKTSLDELNEAYQKCGKAFFGPIVPNRNHQNGVMIYPWNTASRCPIAMNAIHQAWDYIGTPDMINDRADAEPLIQHCWGSVNNQPHPYEGETIRFNSVDEVRRWVHPQAVLFHRSKYGDLINLLRQMR